MLRYKRYKRMLESRVARLERLIYEKSVGRGGPSIAMNMWTFLMDHGPSTREEIEAGLGPRYSNNPTINSYLNAGLITKQGNRYVANANYSWDDVGVIARDSNHELANMLNDDSIETVDDVTEPVPAIVGRAPRQPRQPRTREVKQNLFSRKYAEVKAAIDAGQDCTKPKENGITPLVYACKDPKGNSADIVRLLLENGANPNDKDGSKSIIVTSIIHNHDNEVIKELAKHGADIETAWKGVSLLVLAMNNRIYDDTLVYLMPDNALNRHPMWWRKSLAYIVADHIEGKISDAVYEQIIEKMTKDTPIDNIYSGVSSSSVEDELRNNIYTLSNLFTSKGWLPPMDTYWWGYPGQGREKNLVEIYYNLLVRASRGELKFKNIDDYLRSCMKACEVLNKPSDFMFNVVTDDWLKQADGRQLDTLVYRAIETGNSKVLSKIANSKPKRLDANSIICNVASNVKSEKVTDAACRILNSCLRNGDGIGQSSVSSLRRSNNRYIIEYMFERGYADDLLYGISDVVHTTALSEAFKNVVNELGIKTKDWNDDSVRQKLDNDRRNQSMINSILSAIKYDEWSREQERYVTENPGILFSDKVQDALEDPANADNVTVAQLKRRIERMPKDQEKYDF